MVEFDPKLDWVDVPDPQNPPAGAAKIKAADLIRYERFMAAAADLINAAGKEGVVDPTDPNAVMFEIAQAILKVPTLNPGTQKLWDSHLPSRLSEINLSQKIEQESGQVTGLLGGKNYILLSLSDPIPPGTPAGTMIFRSANVTAPVDPDAGAIPDPATLALLSSQGNMSSGTGATTTASTIGLRLPTRVKVGDTLIAVVSGQNPTSVPNAWLAPSNWQILSNDAINVYRPTAIMAYRINTEAQLLALPETVNFTLRDGVPAGRLVGAMFRMVNGNAVNIGAGSSAWGGSSTTSGSTMQIPAFTSVTPFGLSIAVVAMNNSAAYPQVGIPGMTKVGQFGYLGTGSTTQIAIFTADYNTAAVPARTVNGDSVWTNAGGVQVGVRSK